MYSVFDLRFLIFDWLCDSVKFDSLVRNLRGILFFEGVHYFFKFWDDPALMLPAVGTGQWHSAADKLSHPKKAGH